MTTIANVVTLTLTYIFKVRMKVITKLSMQVALVGVNCRHKSGSIAVLRCFTGSEVFRSVQGNLAEVNRASLTAQKCVLLRNV